MIRCNVVEVRIDYRTVTAAKSKIYLEIILEEPLVEELIIAYFPALRRGERDILVLIFPLYIVAYLYYQKKDNNSLSEIIVEIAVELNLTEESVENYLVAVSTFKPKYNADFYASDDEDNYYSSAMDSVANDLDTEALYFKLLRQEKLNNALADLRKPDRLLIEYVYGICPKCLKNKEKKTLREASLLLGLTEDGAEKKLKNILNKLKKSMEE